MTAGRVTEFPLKAMFSVSNGLARQKPCRNTVTEDCCRRVLRNASGLTGSASYWPLVKVQMGLHPAKHHMGCNIDYKSMDVVVFVAHGCTGMHNAQIYGLCNPCRKNILAWEVLFPKVVYDLHVEEGRMVL